jgi:hypothetical protein
MDELLLNVKGIDATRLLVIPIFKDQLDVMSVFKTYQNVKHGKSRIHHLNELELNLIEDDGCGFVDSGSMNITDRTMYVFPVKGQITQCYDEFKCTYVDELLNTGLEKGNLEGTEVGDLILMQAEKALRKTYDRLLWFGDKASANNNVNGIDGLWSVYFAEGIAAGDIKNVDINSGSPLVAGDGKDILTKVWENSPSELKAWAMNEKAFYVSGSVYEQYMKDLEGQGATTAVSENYTNLVNGLTALTFRGIPVIPFYSWDSFYNGKGQLNEHRVLFTVPGENIVIGTDAQSDLNTIESKYFWKDEKMYTRIKSVFGVNYATDVLLSLGL